MTRLFTIALVITMMGSVQAQAENSTQSVSQKPTHVWGVNPDTRKAKSSKRSLAKNFKDNNQHCATQSANVADYEACMVSRGYKLKRAR